jgi:hypothetical protein
MLFFRSLEANSKTRQVSDNKNRDMTRVCIAFANMNIHLIEIM